MSTPKQDKTEKATPQKQRKARKEGQVPRSKDLASAALIMGCSIMLTSNADWFATKASGLAKYNMLLTRAELDQPDMMVRHLGASLVEMLSMLTPLFIMVALLAAIAGALPGGPIFNFGNANFKYSRIDPISGIGRIFSTKSLVELFKSTLKIVLLIGIMLVFLQGHLQGLLSYSQRPIDEAVRDGIDLLSQGMLYLGTGLLVIAFIDVPYQYWNHNKELRMSRQEVKDEHTQQEGKPEIKAKIRQLQQRMAQSRAAITIPKADVLLVNPTHYAVALKYNPDLADAPYVLTKGTEELALYMRELAKKHNIEIIDIPPLTRAIYHSTQVDQQIPSALFIAIAHVLSYVMQIKAARKGLQQKPAPLPHFFIPPNLRHD
ncbi:flagellar biosynthesis protein FlhB [Shewanella morhuae]|uniref:Flagellar biosynthetic protein FlhB n=1 Tax=Shewanella morhuae TaxID=365591 RepID=A0ABX5HXI2_9GAMM|nr:flagellar biosynthesis protein FlhB [Shewanella morhuae]PTA51623.1 flagellar biosynthesis protein FlhB [Shewanella morhuae]SIQ97401.1 flagellar biosynthetic protein FlhB [Shewanella morhuae]